MRGIIELLAEYFKTKKEFIKMSASMDEYSKQNHPFFEQEAVLLQTCKCLEKTSSLNSLHITMMQWYYTYVEAKSVINKDHYVDFLETQRRMRALEQAEKELYAMYMSWLN